MRSGLDDRCSAPWPWTLKAKLVRASTAWLGSSIESQRQRRTSPSGNGSATRHTKHGNDQFLVEPNNGFCVWGAATGCDPSSYLEAAASTFWTGLGAHRFSTSCASWFGLWMLPFHRRRFGCPEDLQRHRRRGSRRSDLGPCPVQRGPH